MNFLTISFYLGIILLLLCILILISPLRDRFSNATQRIQGFGLNLEVSVMTLLVLISVGLMTSGIWLQLKDINAQLQSLEAKKAEAELRAQQFQRQLEESRKMELPVFLTLEGVEDVSRLNFTSLECTYVTSSNDEPIRADVAPGRRSSDTVKVVLKDLTREVIIDKLEIYDRDSETRWRKVNFRPLQPTYELRK
jgi:hypothetical protein